MARLAPEPIGWRRAHQSPVCHVEGHAVHQARFGNAWVVPVQPDKVLSRPSQHGPFKRPAVFVVVALPDGEPHHVKQKPRILAPLKLGKRFMSAISSYRSRRTLNFTTLPAGLSRQLKLNSSPHTELC